MAIRWWGTTARGAQKLAIGVGFVCVIGAVAWSLAARGTDATPQSMAAQSTDSPSASLTPTTAPLASTITATSSPTSPLADGASEPSKTTTSVNDVDVTTTIPTTVATTPSTTGAPTTTTTIGATNVSTTTTTTTTTTTVPTTTTSSTTSTTSSTSTTSTTTTLPADTVAPSVSGVTSSTGNGSKKFNTNIVVQVTFTEPVVVVGSPQITMETGTTDRTVTLYSGSGTTTLTFNYRVQNGDVSSDLDYVSAQALTLNGATIRDAAGNDAVLTLPTPGAANSLSANKALIIDTTVPTLVSSAPSDDQTGVAIDANLVFTFSETVNSRMLNKYVYLRRSIDDVTVESFAIIDNSQVSGTTEVITINPTANLAYGTSYYIVIEDGFGDNALNYYIGVSAKTALNFTTVTGDVTAPTLVSSSPVNNAIDRSLAPVITLNFSEPVFGQASKFVHIKRSSDNTIFESLFADGSDNPGSIDGEGTTQLVLRPAYTPTFDYNTSYYIVFDEGAFLDAAGNAFAQLSTSTGLVFTTLDRTCQEKMDIGQACEIGDVGPGGGVIFYTSGTGDNKYMEVAPLVWNGNSTELAYTWCHSNISVATGTAIGTGKTNTAAIASACSSGAAKAITNKNNAGGIGSKTDWFLPSKDELNQLCRYVRQQAVSTAACETTGPRRAEFVGASYWSSSSASVSTAWYQKMQDGVQYAADGTKTISVYTRPVRAFGQPLVET